MRHLRKLTLDRRTLLRGAGVAVALPHMEAMARAGTERRDDGKDDGPRRLVYTYFPNGCSLPSRDDAKYAHWRWFPRTKGEGEALEFTDVLAPLEPHKDHVSLIGGMSHPKSRQLLGHLAGDTWLTAGDLRGSTYLNRESVDQVAARTLREHTRYPSLVLSTDGGVGYKSRVSTLSFDAQGRPIASEHKQRAIFERYFGDGSQSKDERRRSLARGQRIVDLVLEDSKRLRKRLGAHDRDKMDEYLSTLERLERQIERNERWLDVPMKAFTADHLELDPDPGKAARDYLRATFDLVVLALQTDVTRVVTHMLGREDGMGFGDNFPKVGAGINKGHHTISHDTFDGHWDEWGRFDRWYAEQFAYFIGRLREVRDEHGPLLDRTLVVYGSSCSTTHNARNYPTAIIGGSALGVKHGTFRHFEARPFSDLLLSTLRIAGVEAEAFGDSEAPVPLTLTVAW